MAHSSLIEVIKVNDLRTGVSKVTGRDWELQDAEALLLRDDGSPEAVGVLRLSKSMRGLVHPGLYLAGFSLRPNLQTRQIEAQLVRLQPVDRKTLAPKGEAIGEAVGPVAAPLTSPAPAVKL